LDVLHFIELEAVQGSFTIPVSELRAGQKLCQVLKCILSEKLSWRRKVLLPLVKEPVHFQLKLKKGMGK
jgi:hypothetical protein